MTRNLLPKLDLNITNRCNYRCVHCAFNSGLRPYHELSALQYQDILSETRRLGGQRIDLTGGEPTLRSDLEQILSIAKKLDFNVELVSNGSLLNEEKIAILKKLGLDAIALSLDGATFESHAWIRRISRMQYAGLLRAIRCCSEAGLKTKVNTLVTAQNLDEIPRIAEIAIRSGAAELGLYYFTPVGRGRFTQARCVEPRLWLRFIRERLSPFVSTIKLSIETPLLEKGLCAEPLGCIALSDSFHLQILPDGLVFPCAIMASYGRPIASLLKQNIRQIWRNEKLWGDYGRKIQNEVMRNHYGSCVSFRGFEIKDYRGNDFSFVCPLRKFSVEELTNGPGKCKGGKTAISPARRL